MPLRPGSLRPMPLGPPWGIMGAPHGDPPMGPLFPEKIFAALPRKNFFRVHKVQGTMGPQTYDI